MEPFKGDILLNEESRKTKSKGKKKLMIIGGFFLTFAVVSTLCFYVYKFPKRIKGLPLVDMKSFEETEEGEIECKYEIKEKGQNRILSDEFENKGNSIKEIYVNEEKIGYRKEYNFPEAGKYKIKFILNSEVYLDKMFKDVSSLVTIESTSGSDIKILSMNSIFEGCNHLDKITIQDSFDTSKLTSLAKVFKDSAIRKITAESFNTKNVKDMSYMFNGCKSLTSLKLYHMRTDNVEDMSYMFDHCESLTSLKLKSFNTKNVENMSHMFSNLYTLTSLSLSYIDVSKVKYMDYMFYNDRLIRKLDLEHFDTQNVEKMNYMFANCYKLEKAKIDTFETSNVVNFEYMFKDCSKLKEINITNFNTLKCNKFKDMFKHCKGNAVIIKEDFTKMENLLDYILESEINIKFEKLPSSSE